MNPNPYSDQRLQTFDYAVADGTVVRFMNNVYAWMCAGLALTAAVGWWVSTQPNLIRSIFSSGTFIFLVIIELVLVVAIGRAINAIGAAMATGMFLLYSALNGLTLSVIFLQYSLPTITGAFVVSAGMFGAMSLIGFTTKRDLTSLGSFLLMGLIGMIIASVVNIFMASSALYWLITYAGVILFLGLTAYDTQKLKQIAAATRGNEEVGNRLAIVGSLSLYLDFINLFLLILRVMGRRK